LSQSISNKDYLYVGIQFVLFAAYILPIQLWNFSIPIVCAYAGVMLIVIGLLLAFIALLQINRRLSPFPRPVTHSKLLITGAFALSRHPIYTGILLVTFGYSLYSTSLYKLFISIALAILFYFKSKYEESLLIKKHEAYKTYQRQTRRFL
jgi:protein-S-isoprenylcysteine O-methyltransferase Ste14